MASAPATMPATTPVTFSPAAWPAPPATVSCRVAADSKPTRLANANTGISPAHDTKLGSSKRADTRLEP